MKTSIEPFPNCPALDGYHCQSNSLAKIYHHYGYPLSEDMLLGLGAGMSFIYWHQKGAPPFVGARGNNKDFFKDIGRRTGVKIEEKTTKSEKRARKTLLEKMECEEPAMLFGDMAYMPWFDFPEDYHFGGHTFVVCGYDGDETVLISDMDQYAAGLKKGFYHQVSLDQLSKARDSEHKPFPPKNMYLNFDFSEYHDPTPEDIDSAIRQAADTMINAPISNVGVRGIRRTAKEIQKWPNKFDDHMLRLNLFNVYIFTEIGGTGGGSFRYMYSRFLKEAAQVTKNDDYCEAGKLLHQSGRMFTEMGLLFKDIIEEKNVEEKIKQASQQYEEIADMEEKIFSSLLKN